MPYDNVPEDKQAEMETCVSDLKDKGQDEESAIKICYSSVVEGKTIDVTDLKLGAMISRSNMGKLQAAHDVLKDMGVQCAGMKDIDQEIVLGGEIKALDDSGKVGGYLVRFSNQNEPDLSMQKDFFTKDTDFGPASEASPWFHHRLPIVIDGKVMFPAIKRQFGGPVKLTKDDVGIFAEAILNLRDAYEKKVHEYIQAGKIGWSSGTNKCVRVEMENGTHWIKSWELGEDASYTPSPAEFRNTVKISNR